MTTVRARQTGVEVLSVETTLRARQTGVEVLSVETTLRTHQTGVEVLSLGPVFPTPPVAPTLDPVVGPRAVSNASKIIDIDVPAEANAGDLVIFEFTSHTASTDLSTEAPLIATAQQSAADFTTMYFYEFVTESGELAPGATVRFDSRLTSNLIGQAVALSGVVALDDIGLFDSGTIKVTEITATAAASTGLSRILGFVQGDADRNLSDPALFSSDVGTELYNEMSGADEMSVFCAWFDSTEVGDHSMVFTYHPSSDSDAYDEDQLHAALFVLEMVEAVVPPVTLDVDLTDTSGSTDELTSQANYDRTLADTSGSTDDPTATADYDRTLADGSDSTDDLTATADYDRTLVDDSGSTDELATDIAVTLADTSGSTDEVTATANYDRTLVDVSDGTDELTATANHDRTLVDVSGSTDELSFDLITPTSGTEPTLSPRVFENAATTIKIQVPVDSQAGDFVIFEMTARTSGVNWSNTNPSLTDHAKQATTFSGSYSYGVVTTGGGDLDPGEPITFTASFANHLSGRAVAVPGVLGLDDLAVFETADDLGTSITATATASTAMSRIVGFAQSDPSDIRSWTQDVGTELYDDSGGDDDLTSCCAWFDALVAGDHSMVFNHSSADWLHAGLFILTLEEPSGTLHDITLTDVSDSTDELTATANYDRTLTGVSDGTDELVATANYNWNPVDVSGSTDEVTVTANYDRTLVDPSGSTDQLNVGGDRTIPLVDTLGSTDEVSTGLTVVVGLTDDLDSTDELVGSPATVVSLTDTSGSIDELTTDVIQSVTLTDTTTSTDDLAPVSQTFRTLVDVSGSTDEVTGVLSSGLTLTDNLVSVDSITYALLNLNAMSARGRLTIGRLLATPPAERVNLSALHSGKLGGNLMATGKARIDSTTVQRLEAILQATLDPQSEPPEFSITTGRAVDPDGYIDGLWIPDTWDEGSGMIVAWTPTVGNEGADFPVEQFVSYDVWARWIGAGDAPVVWVGSFEVY